MKIKSPARLKTLFFLALVSFALMSAAFADKTVKDITVTVKSRQDDLAVVVKAPKFSSVQFYIFDVYGQLVNRCEIIGSKTLIVQKLSKGTYLYDAFANDTKIKSGKIEMK